MALKLGGSFEARRADVAPAVCYTGIRSRPWRTDNSKDERSFY
jgi:hypothetical protein